MEMGMSWVSTLVVAPRSGALPTIVNGKLCPWKVNDLVKVGTEEIRFCCCACLAASDIAIAVFSASIPNCGLAPKPCRKLSSTSIGCLRDWSGCGAGAWAKPWAKPMVETNNRTAGKKIELRGTLNILLVLSRRSKGENIMNTAIVLNVNSGVYWRQLFTNPKAAQEQHSLSRELLALSR